MASHNYDIFISFKHKKPNGKETEDSLIAKSLHAELTALDYKVFMSLKTLEELGISDYKTEIDNALDEAETLIVIGTSPEHITSKWVKYEWSSFYNDILSEVKPTGRLFAYLKNCEINELPRPIRQSQVFFDGTLKFKELIRFVENKTTRSIVTSAKTKTDSRPNNSQRKWLLLLFCLTLVIAGYFILKEFTTFQTKERRIKENSFILDLQSTKDQIELGKDDFQVISNGDELEVIPLVEGKFTIKGASSEKAILRFTTSEFTWSESGSKNELQLANEIFDTVTVKFFKSKTPVISKTNSEPSKAASKSISKSSYSMNSLCLSENNEPAQFTSELNFSDHITFERVGSKITLTGSLARNNFSGIFSTSQSGQLTPMNTNSIQSMNLILSNDCNSLIGQVTITGRTGVLTKSVDLRLKSN